MELRIFTSSEIMTYVMTWTSLAEQKQFPVGGFWAITSEPVMPLA